MNNQSSECERTSDNRVFSCPPRMADGRHFTDYRPRCMGNFTLNNDPLNSFEYRQYLIKNTDSIMKNNTINSYKQNTCGPCVDPYDQGTVLPDQYVQSCDKDTCKFVLNDQNGLGVGRGVESSSSKASFLKNKENEQMYFRNRAPCVTQEDDVLAFPYGGYVTDNTISKRATIPSGAPLYSFIQ